jgi:ribosomal protein L11 methyltransferase
LIGKKYDVVIANINRNILLSDMKKYTDCLSKNGVLLLSGFYKDDITIIENEVIKHGLVFDKMIQRNSWVALKYTK